MIISRNEYNFQTIRNIQLVINGEDLDNELNKLFIEYNKLVTLANEITTKPIVVNNPLKLNNLIFKNIGDGNISLAKIEQNYIGNITLDFSKFNFLINKIYKFNQFSKNNADGKYIELNTNEINVINTMLINNELQFIGSKLRLANIKPKSLKLQNFKKKSISKDKFKPKTVFRQVAIDSINNDLIADNSLSDSLSFKKGLTLDIIDDSLRKSRKDAIQRLNNFEEGLNFHIVTGYINNEHIADKLLMIAYEGDAVNYGTPRPNTGTTDGYTGKLFFTICATQTFTTDNIGNKSLKPGNFNDNDIFGKKFDAFSFFDKNLLQPKTLSKNQFFKPVILNYDECIDWEHLDDELYNLWRPYYKQPLG